MNLLGRANEYKKTGGWRAKLGDDREIWERVCHGDGGAFEALYQEHGPRVVAFLRRVTGDPQTAEDVMQETFAQIWKRPNGFEPERGTLKAYLFGAARKRAAEWWRKNGRENGTSISHAGTSHAGTSHAGTSRAGTSEACASEAGSSEACASRCKTETGSIVGDAFQRLPEEQRTLLWLREVEGQSYTELAAILEIPVGTVRSRLFAAREELRRVWNGTAKVKEVSR